MPLLLHINLLFTSPRLPSNQDSAFSSPDSKNHISRLDVLNSRFVSKIFRCFFLKFLLSNRTSKKSASEKNPSKSPEKSKKSIKSTNQTPSSTRVWVLITPLSSSSIVMRRRRLGQFGLPILAMDSAQWWVISIF